jgi:hypothetical protein
MGFEVYPQKTNVEMDPDKADRFEPTGEYGWRYRDANGQITATSGEGYSREEDAERAVRDFSGDVVKGHANLEVKHVEE